MENKKVIIVGNGNTGLTSGRYLQKLSNSRITIIKPVEMFNNFKPKTYEISDLIFKNNQSNKIKPKNKHKNDKYK